MGHLIITAQNKFVYDRRSDIGPPRPGSVRKRLAQASSSGNCLPLDSAFFSRTRCSPKATRGFSGGRVSYKVNRLLELAFSRASIIRTQERLGLGHTRVVLAQRHER